MERQTQDRIKQAIRRVLIEGMDDFGTGTNTRPPGDMTQPVSNGTFNNSNRSYYNGAYNNNAVPPTDDFGNPIGPRRPQFNPRAPIPPSNPYGVPNPPQPGKVGQGSDGRIYLYGRNGYPIMVWNGQYWEYMGD
jgi:hypothetical protein